MAGILYLIPTPLGDRDIAWDLPPRVPGLVASLSTFLVEEAKSARRFLKRVAPELDLSACELLELNEHTKAEDLPRLLQPLEEGRDVGLFSEAGCPVIADPGANVVQAAHQIGCKVVPMVGPSSILLALMASGLNGQRFTFRGYLPVKQPERNNKLLAIDRVVAAEGNTQIFIETPYRNTMLLQNMLHVCSRKHLLCIAQGLGTESEKIETRPLEDWKDVEGIPKVPAVFLLGARPG